MDFRAAAPEDIAAIAELLLRASPGRTLEHEVAYVAAYFDRPETQIRIALRDGLPVGIVSFEPSLIRGEAIATGDLAYLRLIAVDPELWGTGVATDLMRWAVEAMHGAGYTGAYLWCGEANARARRFYEREGWRPDGRARHHADWGPMRSYVRTVAPY